MIGPVLPARQLRYEHASLVLTSDLSFSGWAGVSGDQTASPASSRSRTGTTPSRPHRDVLRRSSHMPGLNLKTGRRPHLGHGTFRGRLSGVGEPREPRAAVLTLGHLLSLAPPFARHGASASFHFPCSCTAPPRQGCQE
jgi:hypothetical protein